MHDDACAFELVPGAHIGVRIAEGPSGEVVLTSSDIAGWVSFIEVNARRSTLPKACRANALSPIPAYDFGCAHYSGDAYRFAELAACEHHHAVPTDHGDSAALRCNVSHRDATCRTGMQRVALCGRV